MRDEFVAAANVEIAREGLKVAIDRGSVLGGIFFGAVPETVPETRLHKVGLPTAARARRAFLRDWARRNSRRAAAGLAPILLILPLAGAASAQEGLVDLSGLDGVAGSSVLENGEILIRLENGKSLRLDASLVRVEADGTIFVTAYAAEVIAAQGVEGSVAGANAGGASLLGAGVAGLALAGAAGGGTGGGAPVSPPVELAYAIDGYLAGAQIFGDANGNGVFDAGEIQSTTSADGSFNAALFPDDVTLVAVGGIDISTGEPFTGTLKAPAGSTVITPLTTLIQTVIDNDDGSEPLSPADAAAQIGSALGLTGDLLNDDPVAIAEQDGSLAQLEASAKIAALINLVTAAAPGDPEGAVDAVLANIAASLTDGAGSEILSDATQIGNALDAAGDLIEVDSTALAAAITTASTEIGTAVAEGGLAELEAVQSVVQGGLTEAVEQSVGQTGTTALDTANGTDIYAEAVALRPVITAFTPTDDPINGAGGVEVSGTGRPGTLVIAELGLASSTATVDAEGNWSITFASLGIKAAGTPDENIALVVTAETASGVTSAPATGAPVYLVDTLRPSGFQFIEITGQDARYINAEQMANAAITGNGEPGSILTYTINGGPDQVLVVPENGFISIDISNDFVQELNTVFFTVRDAAGNVGQGGTGSLSYYVDTIAPETPTSSYDNAVLSQPTPGTAFSGTGTGEPGAFVDTFLLQEGEAPIFLGRTTVQPDGSWSFTSLLNGIPEGEYQVQAVSPDQAGNESAAPAEQLIIDYSAPATPAITSVSQIGASDIVDGDYVISGTAEPNTAILVSVDGANLPETTSDGSGNWSVSVTASDGTFDVAVVARDEFSRLSGQATVTIEVDTTAPTIDTVVVDDLVSAAESGALAVTGTVSDAGAGVDVTIYRIEGGGRLVVANTTVTADGAGVWQAGFDLSNAADGDYEIDLSVGDGVNAPTAQQAAASFTLDKIAPELAVNDPATNLMIGSTDLVDGAYTILGTAENGASVAVTINGSTTAVEATDGTWFVERTAVEGDDVISVIATDAAGNSSTPVERTVTYDATPPVNVAIDSFDSVVNSLAAEVVFSGTAEEGATVEVEIQPTAGSPIALTLDSFTGGAWTASGPIPAEDTYTVAVTVTDAAGNTTEVVSVASFVVDTTPPAAPTGVILSGDDGNGVINLAEESYAALHGTASAGAEVTYETSLGASGSVFADPSTGAFTIPLAGLLGDGDTNVAVREIDGAGNPSAPVDVLVSADLTAPATPAIDTVAGDNVIDATEAAGGTITYTGTGETGSFVEFFISGASAGTAEVTGGVWAITADVPSDGDYQATIEAIDFAGNVTAGLPIDFTVSTTDPAVSIDPLAVGAVANEDEVSAAITVSGDFSHAASVGVRVLDGAVEVLAKQAAALDVGAGTWTIDLDLSGLGDGDFTIEAIAESGGVTASSTVALSIDATAPAAPVFDLPSATIDADGVSTVEIAGTGDAGSIVTVSSSLFATPIEVTVAGDGAWTTGPLDLSSRPDGEYTITAVASDAAGNTSGAANATRTLDAAPPVAITLNSGEVEGDFVLFSADEFAIYQEPGESELAVGVVSGVPAGTTVTLDLAGTNGTGLAFTLSYDATTDAAGNFSISIPEADIIANDGMREPGTVTFSVGGSTLNLEFLVNSAINDGTGSAFLVGRHAAEPVADAEATLGLTGMDLEQAGILSDGTLVAIMNSNTDLGYQVIATYDDTGEDPVEFFAFDGGGFADLAVLSSQVFLRGDEVLIAQASLSGTLDPRDVTQQDEPLYTVYRVPAASLADALPALGESPNFNSAAGGVTSFTIGLQDIDSSYVGGGIPPNIAYLFTNISGTTGDPLVLVTREDVSMDSAALSEAYLVSVDLDSETVTSYPVEASSLWFDEVTQELAPEKIFEAIQTDDDGNYVLASFEAPGSGDGILRGVIYDYGAEQFGAAALGDSGSRQVMVTVGGLEIIDGGDGGIGEDDDVIVVGNTTGTEGNLQVTVSGGLVTLSVDTTALLPFFEVVEDNGVDPLLISFDLFALGSATMTDIAGSLGATYTQVTSTDSGTTTDGFEVGRVTFDLDLAGLRAVVNAGTAPSTVDLFSTAASGVDGSSFYGFGANVASDPTIAGDAPVFDGLIKVGGVDGSGTQIVVVEDSAGRGGSDLISGLDISSGVDEDIILIEADFGVVYQGTGFETIPEGEGPFALAGDTGIVVFQGTNSIEDEAVVTMVNDAGLGLVNKSLIVVVADASGTGLFSIHFDGDGLASLETTDSFARVDGLTDLSTFGADNIELLPTIQLLPIL